MHIQSPFAVVHQYSTASEYSLFYYYAYKNTIISAYHSLEGSGYCSNCIIIYNMILLKIIFLMVILECTVKADSMTASWIPTPVYVFLLSISTSRQHCRAMGQGHPRSEHF